MEAVGVIAGEVARNVAREWADLAAAAERVWVVEMLLESILNVCLCS